MYKIIKDVGVAENVYLQNTDTMAELNLGRITPHLISILSKDGYKFESVTDDDETISMADRWNLTVNSEETKEALRRLAMPMKKPIRDQRKEKEEKKIVDVLDIIYGLA